MKKKVEATSLFEKEMMKPSFKQKFEKNYPLFNVEVQLLNELEKQNMTYVDFAELIGTKKSNVSRDLKQGGLQRATLERLKKMASALGCAFIPLIIPKAKEDKILHQIENIISHA